MRPGLVVVKKASSSTVYSVEVISLYYVILQLQVDGDLIAAQRVVAFRHPVRAFQFVKVARA